MLQRIAVISLALAVLVGAAPAHRTAGTKFNAILAPYVSAKKFWGTVEVVQNGRVVFRRSAGPADLAWDVPNRPDTVYEIASLSKQFTGAAILQLAERKKLDIDDPVSKCYPQVRGVAGPLPEVVS